VNTPEESIETFEYPSPPLVSNQGDMPSHLGGEVHPDNPPWGIWQALLTWALSMLLLLFVPAILSLPYILYRYPGVPLTREILISDKTFLLINVLCFIPIHLLTFLLVWAVVTQLGRYNFWTTIGWSWPANLGPWKSAGLAVLLFGVALVFTNLLPGEETDIEKIVQSSRAAAYTLAIMAVATAPLVEELVYRGVLYSAFQRAIGATWTVLLVSVLFAAGHVYQYRNNLGVISAIVLLSVVLTLVRARTGRLLPSFIIHLVFNGIQSVGIVAAPYLRALDSGGEQPAAFILIIFRVLRRVV
jgi:membrane protease YdiL (CAAX protease family)